MESLNEIGCVVKAIQRSAANKVPVKVTATAASTEQLLDILIDNKYVSVTKIHNKIYTLKSETLVKITVGGNQAVKCKKIPEYALKLLPSVSGIIILSTPKGVMTHEKALQLRTGGKLLAVVY